MDKYRPDIDGLRAIAVIGVVCFHAFPQHVGGGFIGVDIFFVISGYLITGIIIRQQSKNEFSYREFYARRIRRIFPALALVLTVSLVLGWLILLPGEFKSLGKHTFAGAAFVSNFAFWREMGYFDGPSDHKPLLHLWSLGIEEQFYIVWPLLIISVIKWSRWLLPVLLLVCTSSFAFNIWASINQPTTSFYMPLSRFWELSTGGLIHYLNLTPSMKTSENSGQYLQYVRNIYGEALSWAGLFLLGVGFMVISEEKHFPGWWATLPVFGTAMLIGAGPDTLLARNILSTKLIVFIGLISYPLYLWHWPLFSFMKITSGSIQESTHQNLILCLLSVVLASGTYILVEQPIRGRNLRSIGPGFLVSVIATIGFFGLIIYLSNGHNRQSKNKMALDLEYEISNIKYGPCPDKLNQINPSLEYCYSSANLEPRGILIGDSHAEHLFHGLTEISHFGWLLAGSSACPPVLGINIESTNPSQNQILNSCKGRMDEISRFIHSKSASRIQLVILAFYQGYPLSKTIAADQLVNKMYLENVIINGFSDERTKLQFFEQGLANFILSLEKAGKKIIIIRDIPELPFFPRSCITASSESYRINKLFRFQSAECSLLRSAVEVRQRAYSDMLKRVMRAHSSVQLFDPLDYICDNDRCFPKKDGVLFYRDSTHLSLRGSGFIGENIMKFIHDKYYKLIKEHNLNNMPLEKR
ncbi:MAG: acyltransferase [Acidobacteriota bacterium]|nr:MAG: acyltransferase [Acidobacteriota bacterium]